MIDLFFILLLFIFGLILGSFISAYTYRWPNGLSVKRGRSICPKCKKNIVWFDNIPLLSYIFLKGKCRNCHKKISIRYPLIELSTAAIFVLIYLFYASCNSNPGFILESNVICIWKEHFSIWALLSFFVIASALMAIFIIDLEHQVIPDELTFLIFTLTSFFLLISESGAVYEYLFSGFLASTFLLLIHLVTLGRGMGLGDVKLALFGGAFFGWPLTYVWIFSSFIIGAIVGVFLIAIGKAHFGKQIAFGPFLVISLFFTLFWGERLAFLIIP